MDDELWNRASEIFAQAIDLSPDEVEAFLEKECAGDQQLSAEVRRMLDEDADATNANFLSPVFTTPFSESDRPKLLANEADSVIGRDLGPYRVERLIGHGGMGNVYLAVRKADYSSQVAIKLIRHGADSKAVLARFQHEIQLQAALGKHRNIAGILDAGQTEDGIPYFVMEYVEGQPIDSYCDLNQLPIDARLELFADVCSAVQFAHQNTVIHRDLKPSNILVTDDGRPMLIDFGIAKVLAPNKSSTTAVPNLTQTGGSVFTPGYASPEQVQADSLTTATDVYSLGVILYELLVGRPPYDMDSRNLGNVIDAIVRQEPLPPSRAALTPDNSDGSTGDSAAVPTPQRRSELRDTTATRLQYKLAGELDDIVMMALRKDPERRYATASAFEADIRNYLSGPPGLCQARYVDLSDAQVRATQ